VSNSGRLPAEAVGRRRVQAQVVRPRDGQKPNDYITISATEFLQDWIDIVPVRGRNNHARRRIQPGPRQPPLADVVRPVGASWL